MTYPLHMQVDIVALCISQKIRGPFNERDGSRSIVAEEDVEESSTTDNSGQVFMCGTLREVGDQYSSLIMEWYTAT